MLFQCMGSHENLLNWPPERRIIPPPLPPDHIEIEGDTVEGGEHWTVTNCYSSVQSGRTMLVV